MNHVITNVDQARTYMLEQIDRIYKQAPLNHCATIQSLARLPFDDPRYWLVPSSSGTNGRHHLEEGGNAVHTAQVMQSALGILDGVKDFKLAELVTAIVWHDYGKVDDYEWNGERFLIEHDGDKVTTRTTPHYKMIRHLARSAMMFNSTVARSDGRYNSCMDTELVEHIILSHHGRKEWGSPIEPQCVEAWAVHAADMMSSHFCILPR